MSAGGLNRRIEIQRPDTGQDDFGAPQRRWVEVATVWAEVQPLNGHARGNAQRIASEVTHQITVRYQPWWADTREVAGYRALYRSRVFNIHAAINDGERNVFVTLLASEGVNDG